VTGLSERLTLRMRPVFAPRGDGADV
jgi:hypothetical protein